MKEEDGEVGCEILELIIPEAEVGLPLPFHHL
jgi:hypothetical protein